MGECYIIVGIEKVTSLLQTWFCPVRHAQAPWFSHLSNGNSYSAFPVGFCGHYTGSCQNRAQLGLRATCLHLVSVPLCTLGQANIPGLPGERRCGEDWRPGKGNGSWEVQPSTPQHSAPSPGS